MERWKYARKLVYKYAGIDTPMIEKWRVVKLKKHWLKIETKVHSELDSLILNSMKKND